MAKLSILRYRIGKIHAARIITNIPECAGNSWVYKNGPGGYMSRILYYDLLEDILSPNPSNSDLINSAENKLLSSAILTNSKAANH